MAAITTSPDTDDLATVMAEIIWLASQENSAFTAANMAAIDPSFQASFNAVYSGSIDATFKFEAEAAHAYSMMSAVTDITFTYTSDVGQADLVLMSTSDSTDSSVAGYHASPGQADKGGGDYWSAGFFNAALASMQAQADLGAGHFSGVVLLREIGRSMGLVYSDAAESDDQLPDLLDRERYSVMSDRADQDAGNRAGHAVTYMALDLAALQVAYGVSDHADGNSRYVLTDAGSAALSVEEGDMSIGNAYACIWDTGGTDRIVYSGRSDIVINLNAATLDGEINLGLGNLRGLRAVATLTNAERAGMFDDIRTAGGSFS
ncbi:MAG: hypothetical protein EON57_06050, partial [Alphaproteobacteria bacterium]